jgi:hypothetical protein
MFSLNKFSSTEKSPEPKEQMIPAEFKKTGAVFFVEFL